MSTGIEWTDETWNPVTGCAKVSQGCKHCYAERLWPKVEGARVKREGGARRPFTHVSIHRERLDQPLRWAKPRRIFVNSMSDLFHEHVSWEFIDAVFAVMALAQQHTFQILTKRPRRMRDYLANEGMPNRVLHRLSDFGPYLERGHPLRQLPNVWAGVSVEDQPTAEERIPLLLQTTAAVRFLSCEPLLGPIDIRAWLPWKTRAYEGNTPIDWVIAGGESGPRARPSHPDWFRSLRDHCAAAGVAYFFKQWGNWLPGSQYTEALRAADTDPVFSKFNSLRWDGERFDDYDQLDPSPAEETYRVGKKAAGRELDGRTHDEYPK